MTSTMDFKNEEIFNLLNKKKLVIKYLLFSVLILMGIDLQNACAHEAIPPLAENSTLSEKIIQHNSEPDTNIHIPPPSGNSTLSGKLKIIPRIEWLAQPPVDQPTPLKLPVPYVIILHTASELCTDQAKCTALVRYIQNFHIESKGWWDISYNFLVGGDGYVYEGCGWKGEGAHVYEWTSRSIGIAFIGTFNEVLPSNRQILACQQLIQKGVNEGYTGCPTT